MVVKAFFFLLREVRGVKEDPHTHFPEPTHPHIGF